MLANRYGYATSFNHEYSNEAWQINQYFKDKIGDIDDLRRIIHSRWKHFSYNKISKAITLADKTIALACRNCR
jgi:hypothetical protein